MIVRARPRPEAVLRIARRARHDPVAHRPAAAVVAEQHRLERHRADDRDDRDQEAGDAEHPDERQRHRDEQREPERDGDPREDDGAAGRLHRPHDRVVLALPERELLPEAVDDQQRVVDGDPEPDQLHEVRRVGRRRPDARDAVDDPERAADRAGGEDERDRHRPGEPEHEEQHEERDRERDQQLAVPEVAVEDRVEVVLDRGGARDVHLRDAAADARARRAPARCSPWPWRGRASSRHRRRRRSLPPGVWAMLKLAGDPLGTTAAARLTARGEPRLRRGRARGRLRREREDDRERTVRAVAEMLLEHAREPARTRARARRRCSRGSPRASSSQTRRATSTTIHTARTARRCRITNLVHAAIGQT